MRIVYFITSYQSPAAVIRLVETLREGDPDGMIVVHHDVHATPISEETLRDLGVHFFRSDHRMVWGDITLEALRWRVYRWALEHLEFDWMVLLSEQDYPIAPLSSLTDYLAGGGSDALIPAQQVDRIQDPQTRRDSMLRYAYDYYEMPSTGLARRLPDPLPHLLYEVRRLAYTVLNRVLPRVTFYLFPEALQLPTRVGRRRPYAGYREDFPAWYHAAWYSLSRRAVEVVVDFLDRHPDYEDYVARTIIPVESATGSILCNHPELDVRGDATHFARFSDPGSGRPDELDASDFRALVESGLYFARKMPLADTTLLDLLDARVLAPEAAAPSHPPDH